GSGTSSKQGLDFFPQSVVVGAGPVEKLRARIWRKQSRFIKKLLRKFGQKHAALSFFRVYLIVPEVLGELETLRVFQLAINPCTQQSPFTLDGGGGDL